MEGCREVTDGSPAEHGGEDDQTIDDKGPHGSPVLAGPGTDGVDPAGIVRSPDPDYVLLKVVAIIFIFAPSSPGPYSSKHLGRRARPARGRARAPTGAFLIASFQLPVKGHVLAASLVPSLTMMPVLSVHVDPYWLDTLSKPIIP
jgi:hypothetical protein